MKQTEENKKIYRFKEMEFRSIEELYFAWYLEELKEAGYIVDYFYEKTKYSLTEPVKVNWYRSIKTKNTLQEMHLMAGSDYNPDFEILWSIKADGIFYCKDVPVLKQPVFIPQIVNDISFQTPDILSVIDVKGSGGFGYKNASMYTFPLKQKMLWEKHKIYAQKIVPVQMFNKTFTPKRYLYTDSTGSKVRRVINPTKLNVVSLEDFTMSITKQIG